MFDQLVFSGRNLLLIYAALTSNFLRPLIPCNTARFVETSMVFRHVIAFMGLTFFTIVADAEYEDFTGFIPLFVSAVFVYAWFMISSKMSANWWIPLVFLLAILYFINTYRDHAKKLTKDMALYLNYGELSAVILSALITFFGFIIYVGEKKIEYRGKFDFGTFILGTETCKNTPTKTAYWDSLKAAFLTAPGTSGGGQRGGFVSEDGLPVVSAFDVKESVLH